MPELRVLSIKIYICHVTIALKFMLAICITILSANNYLKEQGNLTRNYEFMRTENTECIVYTMRINVTVLCVLMDSDEIHA